MRARNRNQSAGYLVDAIRQPWFKHLLAYTTILFFMCLSDAIMTYFSPVHVESRINNEFLMGIIIASSSMVGLISDILFGGWFTGKTHRFFFRWAIVFFLLFPLSFLLLPSSTFLFFIPMALWGIAFELGLFADFHFINEALDHPHHSIGWSYLKTISAAAYMIGPLIASFLIERSDLYAPLASVICMVTAIGLYVLLKKSIGVKNNTPMVITPKQSIVHEFKVWRVLLPKLWLVIIFIFMASILDATFWTIGAILSENLKELHPFGGFLLTIYMIPSLFAGFIGAHLAGIWGKKRTAFIGGVFAGVFFIAAGLISDILGLLGAVFVASFFMGISVPQIYAAIEDYIERLGQSANALVGLENSTTSISFICGPIIAGAIASVTNDQLTFTVMGAILLGVSILALLIVPRKIHLPQQALQSLKV